MKIKIAMACVLFLTGCSCLCPTAPVRVISNEKNTNIYYNDEFVGSDSTYVILRNRDIDKAKITGEKKGCRTTSLSPEYLFDWQVINILDIRNIARILTWQVYKVDYSRDLYNITPRCD